jgi:threonine/homoserine/homoserine lactone efflux protein
VSIEPWHLSIFVTAGIVLAELAVHAVLRRKDDFVLHKRVRTVALGLLVVLTVVVAVAALGPSLADQLASVAAAVAAVAAAWLAYRSYHASHSGDLSGTGAPPEVKARPIEAPAPAEPPVRHGL